MGRAADRVYVAVAEAEAVSGGETVADDVLVSFGAFSAGAVGPKKNWRHQTCLSPKKIPGGGGFGGQGYKSLREECANQASF